MNNRFKNYGLWASILAFIPIFLKSFGIDIVPENYAQVVEGILGILVLAGIINNPATENKGYKDDKEAIDEIEENSDVKNNIEEK